MGPPDPRTAERSPRTAEGSGGDIHDGPMFTIFVPTYNRAYCLPRALQSVAESSCQDLEVVVVDDGSTDDTPDVVRGWQGRVPYPLRYVHQPNGGKASAHNHALAVAEGYFFINLDSDDSLIPGALDAILAEWASVPADRQAELSGIAGLLIEEDGSISGTPYPLDRVDSDYLAIHALGHIHGDKREATRTSVLREFPYPIIPGERHVRDNLIFRRMAHRYQTRFVNLPLVLGRREADGITANIRHFRARNPRGMRLAFLEEITLHDAYADARQLRRNSIRYIRYSLHSGIGPLRQFREIKHFVVWFTALPEGVIAWLGDRLRRLVQRHP
ncbi:MAG: glycosyltransferase family 2 protein [Chromatiaceae bacterium]|nr:glycosyltransferase family 2 protein [Chromatiaceae bacterium]